MRPVQNCVCNLTDFDVKNRAAHMPARRGNKPTSPCQLWVQCQESATKMWVNIWPVTRLRSLSRYAPSSFCQKLLCGIRSVNS